MGFQFDLKEDSDEKCLTERKRAQDDRSDVLKPFPPRADLKTITDKNVLSEKL